MKNIRAILSLFLFLGIDGNNAVSFDEFYIVMIRKKGNAIYNTSSAGDLNQNGTISASEID